MTSEERERLRAAAGRMAGGDLTSPRWASDVREVGAALLGLLPAADAGEERRYGPRYIVWVGSRQFCTCDTLAEALDWRAKIGGTVYEPLGMAAAERVAAEPLAPAAGGGA